MTRDETKDVLKVMTVAYPNYHPENKTETLNLWAEMLSDYQYGIVLAALKTFIATNTSGFAPSISQLIEIINGMTADSELSESQAWDLVCKATADGYYNSVREFEKLPDTVKRVVGSPQQLKEWSLMEKSTFQSVIASNFNRAYKTELAKEKQLKAMPAEIRQALEKTKVKTIEQAEG